MIELTSSKGDFDVFVDDIDGRGYIIYGCAHYNSIERLSDDFYYTLENGKNATVKGGHFNGSTFPDYFVEAPCSLKETMYITFFMATVVASVNKAVVS